MENLLALHLLEELSMRRFLRVEQLNLRIENIEETTNRSYYSSETHSTNHWYHQESLIADWMNEVERRYYCNRISQIGSSS